MTVAGLISDTHGLLRPQVVMAFAGVDCILHAGDVGRPEILDELRQIAPVTAVRGNVDTSDWADGLPYDTVMTIEGFDLYMLHNLRQMEICPKAANMAAVISGHTHKPSIEMKDSILYINPGSAGPRRFSLPVSVGFIRLVKNEPIWAWLKTLDI